MPKSTFLALLLCAGSAAQAGSLDHTVLYTFPSNPNGSPYPTGPLLAASHRLYGVEQGAVFVGSATALGGVYSLDPGTGESTVYGFADQADGAEPVGNLVLLNGLLFGVTTMGGINNWGTVYSLNPATGVHQVRYSFNDANAGGIQPLVGLTYYNGLLYGTTFGGGSLAGSGSIYSFDPARGTVRFLFGFPTNNTSPSALTVVGGTLYGTTQGGGANGDGAIFATNPATGATTTLYSFAAGTDGSEPTGVTTMNGILYGTASYGGYHGNSSCHRSGCGVIFAYSLQAGTEQVLYRFTAGADGGSPGPVTVANGDLVGSAEGGALGAGIDYRFNLATDALSIRYTFEGGSDGSQPYYAPLYENRALYGVTIGAATVYSLTP